MSYSRDRSRADAGVIGVFPVGTITRAPDPEYSGLLRQLKPGSGNPFRVDVEDDSAGFKVVAELPDVTPESIQLFLAPTHEALTILAERGGERVGREVLLPHPVRADHFDARYADGELRVWLERAPE